VIEAVAQISDWAFANASLGKIAGLAQPQVRNGSPFVYPIYPCKDGHVRLVILSPRQWRAMRAWLGEPEALQEDHWDSFIARMGIQDVLEPLYIAHFAEMSMVEVCVEAQRRGIVCTPLLRPEEVLVNEHLLSRKTFVDTEVAKGIEGPVAAGLFEFDGERQGIRVRAPELGEHNKEVFEAEAGVARTAPAGSPPAPSLPLEGLRVLDFGIGGVGVEGSRMLAEYGADVIKIETRTYPDFIRVIGGTEMCPSFASSSRSKRGFGVNAKIPEGLAVLHRLVEKADVIIENGSTGTMDELGVGYEKLREINPRIVMVSSQLLGSRGVWANWIGYGPSTQTLGGLAHLWSYEDEDDPAGGMAIFPDHLAGRVVATGALAALFARERSGVGAHAEVAQIEVVTGVLGDWFLKAALEPGSVKPRTNKSDRGAPWGAFPCSGEQQWCVINVRDDADWRALRRVLGEPDWTKDAAFDTAEGRLAARDALEARLGEWTQTRDRDELAKTLQAVGVPAGAMLTPSDQFDDPHYAERGFSRYLEQAGVGKMIFEGPGFRASGMSDINLFQAPGLGEHTREICRDLLGMEESEIDRLLESGALEGPLSES
jgi:crotonobetainyl-CoA:carnitine CoA-transferase CaiB-like acyl-CoA transferase